MTLTRRHSYLSLGKFAARLTVANALGVHEVVRVISVERPIRKVSMTVTSRSFVSRSRRVTMSRSSASMTVTNVKLLGQPTTFAFTVDPTLTPAMPVTVRLDYDDGTDAETVTLGTMKSIATPMTHSHTYDRFMSCLLDLRIDSNLQRHRVVFAAIARLSCFSANLQKTV